MEGGVMFSRKTDEWATPPETFDALNAEFAFDIDLAATYENAKCLRFLSDSLDVDWSGIARRGFLNCPYSRCALFIAKAAEERRRGFLTVAIVPSRTDTKWWHGYVWDTDRHQPRPGVEVRFLKGRLKFGNSPNSAPFPSVVIVFRPDARG